MDMHSEHRIAAPREQVWAALNDPEVLARCIPGCKELVKDTENSFTAKVVAAVGPVKATFAGRVELNDIVAPQGYTLAGEGKGGAAGFAKAAAAVKLTEDGEATLLAYSVKATVGGKLAQIGSRLVDGAAKKMADQFFANFRAEMEPIAQPAAALADGADAADAAEGEGDETKRPFWKRMFSE